VNKLKIALVSILAVSSIAAAVPASADPYDGHRDRGDRHGDRHRGDRWDRGHNRGHRVRVCRNVRIHHHWERVCRWEYRRW
jgi:Ni/Co efflux regulator RcnB